MRTAFFVLFLAFESFSFEVSGQNMPQKNAGIAFQNLTLDQVFQQAKSQGKPLFVEIYLKGCPHCEALEPVLQEKEVGDFYNEHFVSWKTEANSAESKKLQSLKHLAYPEFPLFFYFDSAGNMVHMATPAEKPDRASFIKEVKMNGMRALDTKTQSSQYPARFAAGQRNLTFLIQYAKMAKATKADTALRQINDAFATALASDEDRKGKVAFYVLRRFINDYSNPLSVYFFDHLAEFKTLYPEKEVKEAGDNIIYYSLFGSRGNQYSAAEISGMRQHMVALGVPPDEAAGRTLLKETEAFLKEKNTKEALMVFNAYRSKSKTVGLADYAYMIKLFNEKAPDQSYASEMPVWADAGMKLAKPAEKNSRIAADLYYELAESYNRAGEAARAKETAEKALGIAKAAKVELARYEDQVKRFK